MLRIQGQWWGGGGEMALRGVTYKIKEPDGEIAIETISSNELEIGNSPYLEP